MAIPLAASGSSLTLAMMNEPISDLRKVSKSACITQLDWADTLEKSIGLA